MNADKQRGQNTRANDELKRREDRLRAEEMQLKARMSVYDSVRVGRETICSVNVHAKAPHRTTASNQRIATASSIALSAGQSALRTFKNSARNGSKKVAGLSRSQTGA